MAEARPKQFVEALADFIALRTSPALVRSGAGVNLFCHEMSDAAGVPETRSALVSYGGAGVPWTPQVPLPIQCRTIAPTAAAALDRAQAIFETLRDQQGRVLRRTALAGGFTLIAITRLTTPGQIGRDDKGRVIVTFNLDSKYYFAAP
jgi:hypothetical protein